MLMPSAANQMPPMEQLEVVSGMRDFAQETVTRFLKPVNESWQPADYLPDFAHAGWNQEIGQLRDAAQSLPEGLLVVLVGDTITEEALPSYQTWLNGLQGIADKSGRDESPWAQWSRGWTAEENRHGDLLNKY